MSNIKFVKTKLTNSNNESIANETQDYFYLESDEDILNLKDHAHRRSATDHAIANGCKTMSYLKSDNGKNSTCYRLASNSHQPILCDAVVNNVMGHRTATSSTEKDFGYCVCTSLDIDSLLSNGKTPFKVEEIVVNGNKEHLIQFAELRYPKSRVNEKINTILETLFKQGNLKEIGKTITNVVDNTESKEYLFNGKIYIRTNAVNENTYARYEDGREFKGGEVIWQKVEPIKWVIRNWKDMPKEINPNGNGRAKVMDLRTEEAIESGIEMNEEYGSVEAAMWQNSKPRAYFNGYDIHEEIKVNGNGNKEHLCKTNYSYKDGGFMKDIDHSNVIEYVSQLANEVKLDRTNDEIIDKEIEEVL